MEETRADKVIDKNNSNKSNSDTNKNDEAEVSGATCADDNPTEQPQQSGQSELNTNSSSSGSNKKQDELSDEAEQQLKQILQSRTEEEQTTTALACSTATNVQHIQQTPITTFATTSKQALAMNQTWLKKTSEQGASAGIELTPTAEVAEEGQTELTELSPDVTELDNTTPTPSIRSIGSLVCRICHNSENPEALVSPCLCKGSLTYVHVYCLERWISTSRSTICELCQFQYNTEQTLRYTCFQSLRMWYSRAMSRRALQEDCQMFSLLTLIAFAIVGTLLIGIQFYFLQGHTSALTRIWTKGWLIFFLFTTLSVYAINVYMIIKTQLTPWYRWWQSARDIKLILENRKPFQLWQANQKLQQQQQQELQQQQEQAMRATCALIPTGTSQAQPTATLPLPLSVSLLPLPAPTPTPIHLQATTADILPLQTATGSSGSTPTAEPPMPTRCSIAAATVTATDSSSEFALGGNLRGLTDSHPQLTSN